MRETVTPRVPQTTAGGYGSRLEAGTTAEDDAPAMAYAVVPANAGTYNHRRSLLRETVTPRVPQTPACGYGSRLEAGTTAEDDAPAVVLRRTSDAKRLTPPAAGRARRAGRRRAG
ncbi:hypothetical protein SSBR45R_70630 [Bradyrhizobium sp. SSBR45R]|nr:hypothetical protein SSBR45R_70630 [Bradyrhizobium sp. SSBR45R]